MRVIKDAIHGYIDVPKPLFRHFIDTLIFQRLRHIEQTSMRCLYPCARHDRFSHSLGVFHLGRLAFEHLHRENERTVTEALGGDLELVKRSFDVACLLHDCGHAPFSHTCERYYSLSSDLKEELKALVEGETFSNDIDASLPASPHEMVSGIVVMKCFTDNVRVYGADPELVVRMITGCKLNTEPRGNREHVLNAIIEMLNGRSFDVDRLDYAMRDTWASGVRNVVVDVPRLLKALRLGEVDDRLELCFDRSSVSVLKSLLMAVDYLYKWIYSHHKVVYEVGLIRRGVENLMSILDPENGMSSFFSSETFVRPINVGGEYVFLPTDGDLRYLMKKRELPIFSELASRNYSYFPLWKTYADYNLLFEGFSEEDRTVVQKKVFADKAIDRKFAMTEDKQCIAEVEEVRHGAKPVSPLNIKFLFDGDVVSYQKLFPNEQLYSSGKYWHLFVHKDYEGISNNIVAFIKGLRP